MNISKPEIVESFLEHRAILQKPAVEVWTLPNPFISALFPIVQREGSSLTDFAFSSDAKSVGTNFLQIRIRSLNVTVKIFVEHLEIDVTNPDWSMAPKLVPLFDEIIGAVVKVTNVQMISHETTLAIHVTHGEVAVESQIAGLLNTQKLGPAESYGISVNSVDGFFAIEKSLRHNKASFVRLSRKLPGIHSFSDIASTLYAEEVRILGLIGIEGVV